MASKKMTVLDALRKGEDPDRLDGAGDFLRDGLRWLLHELMDAEVSPQSGAERYERTEERTAQVFHAGHRLRVEVTSSDFPRYDRNLNMGGSFGEETARQVAVNRIFCDASRPSHVLLAVAGRV